MRRIALSVFIPLFALVLTGCNREQRAGENATQPRESEEAAQTVDAEQQRKADELAKQAKEQAEEAQQTAKKAEELARNTRRTATRERTDGATDGAERVQSSSRQARGVDLPAGTLVYVRLDQALDSDENHEGDRFTATLDRPVVVNGATVLPAGTRFNGSVGSAESSGRLTGRASLTVRLDSFTLNGKTHRVNTTTISKVTEGHGKRNAVIIGGTTAAGAAIGGIAGGGKGAAIGAGAGAAAGAAGAAATGKLNVKLPAETLLVFTIQQAVNL
jgi:hypothetical protein